MDVHKGNRWKMKLEEKKELDYICSEINSIIKELENISNGLKKEFIGIGNEKCAECIDNVINKYRTISKKISTVTIHSGGGRTF